MKSFLLLVCGLFYDTFAVHFINNYIRMHGLCLFITAKQTVKKKERRRKKKKEEQNCVLVLKGAQSVTDGEDRTVYCTEVTLP